MKLTLFQEQPIKDVLMETLYFSPIGMSTKQLNFASDGLKQLSASQICRLLVEVGAVCSKTWSGVASSSMFIWKHPSPPSGWVVVKNVTADDGAKTETIVGEFEGERAGRLTRNQSMDQTYK